MSHTLVIIGAGFSGIVTFYRLLNSTQRKYSRIVLVDDDKIGGLAYGFADASHLLNVPAGRMSALVEDKHHFLEFARYVLPQAQASDFLPRPIYAAYLRWLLATSKRKATAGLKAIHIRDRAIDICINRRGVARVALQSGKHLSAHKVIIATGNQQSCTPLIQSPEFFAASRRYVAHPWHAAALRELDTTQPLLLIGSGLTAVDIAMSLQRRKPDQPIIMLSRHGLLPQAHRGLSHEPDVPVDVGTIIGAPPRVTSLLRAVRREIAMHAAKNDGNWRDVIVALRPYTPALWQKLDAIERKRFLRHCQIYWDVHRHRIAPEIAEKLHQLQQQGLLTVEAGRVVDLRGNGDACEVTFRRRGANQSAQISVAAVINCTGPDTRIDSAGNGLLQAIYKRGLISQDDARFGIRTAEENYAVLDANGKQSDVIHYVGPWLRAHYWEATAVPELREHVAGLVDTLCDDVQMPLPASANHYRRP